MRKWVEVMVDLPALTGHIETDRDARRETNPGYTRCGAFSYDEDIVGAREQAEELAQEKLSSILRRWQH